MQEEMSSLFQGLGYEEGFGLGEVPPIEVRKKKINTQDILSAVNLEKRREIFDEGGVFIFFFTFVIAFCI